MAGYARLPLAAAVLGGLLTVSGAASAQQRTFHLDRLEVPGSPDDGVVLFRPVTQPKNVFFAQLGVGYSLRPLHTINVTRHDPTINASPFGVVDHQLTQYTTFGFHLLDRMILSATLPVTWWQDGQTPNYASLPLLGGPGGTSLDTSGPTISDARLDVRAVLWRSDDRKTALGAQLSMLVPVGTNFSYNFGNDGQVTALPMVNAEHSLGPVILAANTGVHFRPYRSINNPAGGDGLGIGNEWRWAVGGFVPFKQGKYRLGGTIFGQTGIDSQQNLIGDTLFTKQNTPIEWNVEGRMKFGGPSERWWIGAGGGSKILNGYGAPDMRIIAMVGTYLPIEDSGATSPKKRDRSQWRDEHAKDSDNDGIPDDLDVCPNEAEDGKEPDPSDGCPQPADKDGDGIPDQFDKCPDEPEDKDGIDDGDGCPETDADTDGIPDAQDACPKEPGKPSVDPKRNGCPQFIRRDEGSVTVLQQVHFATGSANILPDSFPMLQEIADLLKVNTNIRRMSIDGHTDDRGADDMNLRLSQSRADSVMRWLVQHGVTQERLEAHGYGETKPIDDNTTQKGRAANRRVEFKIVDESDPNAVPGKQ